MICGLDKAMGPGGISARACAPFVTVRQRSVGLYGRVTGWVALSCGLSLSDAGTASASDARLTWVLTWLLTRACAAPSPGIDPVSDTVCVCGLTGRPSGGRRGGTAPRRPSAVSRGMSVMGSGVGRCRETLPAGVGRDTASHVPAPRAVVPAAARASAPAGEHTSVSWWPLIPIARRSQ